MEQYGLVTETRGETALVNLQRHLVCESCGRCGLLSGSNKREIIVEALNPIQAGEGQRVLLESDDRQVLFISFILYLVPALALVAGIVLWLTVVTPFLGLQGSQELPAVGAGLLLMLIVFLCARIWDRRVKDNPDYKPVITALLKDEPVTIDRCEDEE